MTDPPDFHLFIRFSSTPAVLITSCTLVPCPGRFSGFNTHCFLFTLSRRPSPIAPYSAFKHFCSPDSKQNQGVTTSLTCLLPPELSSAPTPWKIRY